MSNITEDELRDYYSKKNAFSAPKEIKDEPEPIESFDSSDPKVAEAEDYYRNRSYTLKDLGVKGSGDPEIDRLSNAGNAFARQLFDTFGMSGEGASFQFEYMKEMLDADEGMTQEERAEGIKRVKEGVGLGRWALAIPEEKRQQAFREAKKGNVS